MSQVRAAGNPEPRTVKVAITEGAYAGWECTVKADFKARYIADLSSGDFSRILPVLDLIVIEHNFPDADTGGKAETLGDVDYQGLVAVVERFTEALSSLPNR